MTAIARSPHHGVPACGDAHPGTGAGAALLPLLDPLPRHATVAVLGLGSAGIGACHLLGRLKKNVVASDRRGDRPEGIPDTVDVRLGCNDWRGASAVVLSPGLNPSWPENRDNPALSPLWRAWRAGEVEVWSEVDLAVAALGRPWIAVGGTDGKSTTAKLCAELAASEGARVLLGGNSWEAMSSVVARAGAADAAVVEVSAFQSWAPHAMRPRVSVLTNIADDHLDHYGSFEEYVAAKLLIHAHLRSGPDPDCAVLWAGDARLRGVAAALHARGVFTTLYDVDPPEAVCDAAAWIEGTDLRLDGPMGSKRVPLSAIALPGLHNRRNVLGAWLAVDRLLAPPPGAIGSALSAFRGLPHRLELIRELDDVRYYDDSKATNVHAAVTGIRALDRPLVAIVGGVDKGLPLAPLIEALRGRARRVIVIGQLAGRLATEAAGSLPLELAASMDDAVGRARQVAQSGDAVLLAPGASSFDMFRSFEHRGEVFAAAVRAL